jgi:hypothetical protein
MQNNRKDVATAIVSIAVFIAILGGCVPSTNITNCLTLTETSETLGALGLPMCYDDTRQCENAMGPTDVGPLTTTQCAFYHSDAACGNGDTHGCNTYGTITYYEQQWECQNATEGSTFKTCVDEDRVTIIDTGVSCQVPLTIPGGLQLATPCVVPPANPGDPSGPAE